MRPINEKTGLAVDSFGLSRLFDGAREFVALVRPNGEVIDLSAEFQDTHTLYGDWKRNFDRLIDISARASDAGRSVDDYRFLPPTHYPQVMGAGSNYRKHAAEMYTFNAGEYARARKPGESDENFYQRNMEFVEQKRAKGMPFIWMSSHGSLVGANDDIVLPAIGQQHDWEAELCAVMAGGSPRYMNPTEAAEYIAGYTIINDMHTCELFSRDDVKWNADFMAKQQPSFKPVGPFVVPRAFVPTLDDVVIKLWVNGDLKQDWPANDMIFSPDSYAAYASERMSLRPGDLIMTGSPPGNGGFHGQFLQPGDVVDISITYLGAHRNKVVAEDLKGRTPHFGLPPFQGVR